MSEGYHNVNPFLFVEGAAKLIDFLADVFGAVETERMVQADGSVGHAEVRVGDSVIMISEASDRFPQGRSAAYVFVDDVDLVFQRALAAGAQSVSEPSDKFYGNREAGVSDAFGNIWWIATALEQLTASELQRRWEEIQQSQAPSA
jgi:uncharacterized glyoxalase superfamily protein PhnB